MKCECGTDTKTKDSRRIDQGIWRKRFCPSCGAEFTTLEQRCETLRVPYTSKKDKQPVKGQVAAPPVPAVDRPNPPNKRATALRRAPTPLPNEALPGVKAEPVRIGKPALSARDRIEDLKFEREQADYGWDC
jgi:hypothetical protein